MKILFKYIIGISIIGGMLSSCAYKEELLLPNTDKDAGTTLVIASVENFSRHNVATKATDDEERKIKNLGILVYGTNSNSERVLITTPIFIDGNTPNFLINTTDTGNGVNANNITEQYISDIQGTQQSSFEEFAEAGGNLKSCRLYIVANMMSILYPDKVEDRPDISTEEKFLNIGYNIPINSSSDTQEQRTINIPANGFPMIGFDDVDMSPDTELGGNSQEALTISLKKLFAKINIKFRVETELEGNPDDMSNAYKPFFKPESWSVHNVPVSCTLNEAEASLYPGIDVFTTTPINDFVFGPDSKDDGKVEHSTSEDEYFEFSFYMPEYMVLPENNTTDNPFQYPDKITESSKQFFKPKMCSSEQKPVFVQIKGQYSNHQNRQSGVVYNIYLGQNAIDDFQVKRNQELNNLLIIKGLTNHSEAGDDNNVNISVDHRVNVTSSGYTIAMERETLLDSHHELRPMDISIDEGAIVVVKIPKEDENGNPINQWFSAELHSDDNKLGVYDSNKPGLRKYFTPNLITELDTQLATKNYEFVLEANSRIWFYFDENTSSPYDASKAKSETNQLFREGKIYVDYYANGAADYPDNPKEKDAPFTFRQMNLWTINTSRLDAENKTIQYNIEYFEEYLYNYASDDNYGVTTDGIKWGLEDTPLSITYPAIFADENNTGGLWDWILGWGGGGMESFFNSAFAKVDAKYDFYIERDSISEPRDYSGLNFTQEIINQAGIYDKTVTLSGNTESAIEYCYNKNKRNAQGRVDTIHWYLPAIDETEEILVDGFNYFPVFQSKYYWSSQPSYHRYDFKAERLGFFGDYVTDTVEGYYYTDNIQNARATIVTSTSNSENSGVENSLGYLYIQIKNSTVTPSDLQIYDIKEATQPGNQPRDTTHRVRCAYNATGVAASPYPFTDILGTWNVSTGSSTSGGSATNFAVTISRSDDLSKGNIKLSSFLHMNYHDTAYPQYGTYNAITGELFIPMDQYIASNVKSVLYSGSNSADNQTLKLQYNKTSNSFTVVGNNMNLRTSSNYRTSSYIRSFTKN